MALAVATVTSDPPMAASWPAGLRRISPAAAGCRPIDPERPRGFAMEHLLYALSGALLVWLLWW